MCNTHVVTMNKKIMQGFVRKKTVWKSAEEDRKKKWRKREREEERKRETARDEEKSDTDRRMDRRLMDVLSINDGCMH